MKILITKMKIMFVFMLLILGLSNLLKATGPTHNKKVVGYFTEWGIYGRDYLVKDIQADKLTHINFAFIAPFILEGEYALFDEIPTNIYKKSDGSAPSIAMYIVGVSTYTYAGKIYSVGLTIDDPWACIQITNFTRKYNDYPEYYNTYPPENEYDCWDKTISGSYGPNDRTAGIFGEFIGMKKEYPHIKILASIGGWSYSYYFSDIAKTPESRAGFADACKQFLDLFEGRDGIPTLFDGIDLDWEFPVIGGDTAVKHDENDDDNLVSLCQAIRAEIGSEKLLTIAAAQNYKEIASQFKSGLKDSLDFMTIMAYDYAGSWNDRTGMNAPLYGSGNTSDPLYSSETGKYMVIDEAIDVFLNDVGIPASQIVLGVPFYGRTFGNVTNSDNGLFQAFSGSGPSSWPEGLGSVEFNDIVDGRKNNKLLEKNGSVWQGIKGYTRYWDSNMQVPYLFDGSNFISYDDDESLAIKCQYVLDNNLGGAMIWSLDSDLRPTSPSEPGLLLNTIDTTFNNNSGAKVKIDGYVKLNSVGLSGVSMKLYDETANSTSTLTTNASGYYSAFVTINQNYVITPLKDKYSFNPVNISTNNITANYTCLDIAATSLSQKFSVSGKIEGAESLSGVLLSLTGDKTASFTTSSNGEFSFTNIEEGSTITITASKTGYVFTPKNYTYNALSEDKLNQNFTISEKPDYAFTPLPDRVIVGYWHNWENASAPFMRLNTVKDTKYNVCIVSFIETQGQDGYTPIFEPLGTEYSTTTFKEEVQELQEAGIPVLISIGGQNGHVVLTTEEQKNIYVQGVKNIVEEYGFDGIDIDYEGTSMTAFNGPANSLEYSAITDVELKLGIDAIREIYNYFGEGFIITAAPEISYVQDGKISYPGAGQFLPFIYNIKDILSFIHVQLYNYGSAVYSSLYFPDNVWQYPVGADAIIASTEMLLKGFSLASTGVIFPALRQDQVVIGLPASPSAAGSGYVSNTILNISLDYLTKGTKDSSLSYILQGGPYPNLRGVMTWSINWDATTDGGTSSYAYANNAYNYFNGVPIDLPSKYKISGKVKNNLGVYLSGLTVKLFKNNLLQTTLTTDSNGAFEFTDKLKDSYVIEILSTNAYLGTSLNVTLTDADLELEDIILQPLDTKYSITGRILENTSNNKLSNVLVNLVRNNVIVSSTTTNSNGIYEFTNIEPNTDYFVNIPNTNTHIGESVYIASLDANLELSDIKLESIVADLKYTVSGNILDVSSNALSGITVNLIQDNVIIATATTNSQGFYSFAEVLPNSNYIVSVPSQGLYLSKSVIIENLQGVVELEDIVLIKSAIQYNISGTIFDLDKNKLANIIVNLIKDDVIVDIAVSDNNGAFIFNNVTSNSDYVLEIKPATNYIKQYISVENLNANVIVYTTLNKKGRIKGYVKDMFNRPLENVKLYVQSVDSTSQGLSVASSVKSISYDFTDTNGYFNFNDLSNGVKYKITLQKDGYVFSPSQFIITSSSDDSTANTFTTSAILSANSNINILIYPNPCNRNQTDKIIFDFIRSTKEVSIDIYTIRGLLVKTLRYPNEVSEVSDNVYKAEWNCKNSAGNNVASGSYLAIIKGSETKTKKIAII